MVSLCVVSWTQFPFALDLALPYVPAEAIMLVLWFGAVAVALYGGRSSARPRLDKYGMLFLGGYGVYLAGLSVASLLNFGVDVAYQLALVFLKVAFLAFLAFFALDRAILTRLLDVYSWVALALSLSGVALSVVLLVFPFEPLRLIEVGMQGGARIFLQNYGVGFVVAPLDVSCSVFYRVQSFSDEPGTFGFALLPALFWLFLARSSIWRSGVIAVALVLSLSAGAWLALAVAGSVLGVAWRRRIGGMVWRRWRSVALFVLVTLALGLAVFFGVKAACALGYTDAPEGGKSVDYSDARGRSAGKRVEQSRDALDLLLANPEGVGAGQTAARTGVVAVGYMNVLPEGGVVGGLGYGAAMLALLALALRSLVVSSSPENAAIGASVMALLVMGLLRAPPDATFWHVLFLAALIYARGAGDDPDGTGPL